MDRLWQSAGQHPSPRAHEQAGRDSSNKLAKEVDYRALVDHSVDVIFQVKQMRSGQVFYEYVSPSVFDVLGRCVEEMETLTHSMIYPPVSIDLISAAGRQLVQGAPSTTVTVEAIRKDGRRIWVENRLKKIADEGPKNCTVVVYMRDVTERKLLRDQLAEQAITDAAMNEAVPSSILPTRHHGSRDVVGRERAALGQVADGDFAGLNAAGDIIQMRQALAAKDRLQEKLARSTRDLELAFDSVPTILVAFDLAGRVVHWNASAHRTFGLRFDQVRNKPLSRCGVSWLEPEAMLDSLFFGDPVDRRSNHPYELDGVKRWLGVTVRTVRDGDANSGFLVSASDITERREQEEQNRQTHKLEAIGQLAAGIAHEINTPVKYVGDNITFINDVWSSISGVVYQGQLLRQTMANSKLADDGVLSSYDRVVESADLPFVLAELPQAIAQAKEGTQRIARIVKAMKEFSHPGSVEKTHFDLNHAIETTIVIARSEWKYVAEVDTVFDPLLPMVLCYPGKSAKFF